MYNTYPVVPCCVNSLSILILLSRRVNVSHWTEDNCRNGLNRQKTYILLLEQHGGKTATEKPIKLFNNQMINQSHLKASQVHKSAAIEFSQETEANILQNLGKSVGNSKCNVVQCNIILPLAFMPDSINRRGSLTDKNCCCKMPPPITWKGVVLHHSSRHIGHNTDSFG